MWGEENEMTECARGNLHRMHVHTWCCHLRRLKTRREKEGRVGSPVQGDVDRSYLMQGHVDELETQADAERALGLRKISK